jgi:AP-3 complex subunit beta
MMHLSMNSCMRALMKLVSSTSQAVVAQAVVVIRQLLQKDASAHASVVQSLAKLLDTVTHPAARAALVWFVGEYSDKIQLISPDFFSKQANTFS